MNYNKIGNFIETERKAKKLTQAKLAEKVFVSEKTVSKWENGKGLPDTNTLPKLCEVLNVNLNELLSGERINKEKDNKQENQILLAMANEVEQKNKIIWTSMWIILTFGITALIGCLFLTALFVPKGVWQIVLIIAICIVFLIPCFYGLKLELCVGAYKCKKCGHEIIPTYSEALWAMHMGTTRYLKCPNCKKHTWCKKVLNNKK